MDKEKLNKAAEEQANYSTHWSWGDRKECFISGANWLMRQPLSERLTEEEKEKLTPVNRYILEQIFGKDTFEEEGK